MVNFKREREKFIKGYNVNTDFNALIKLIHPILKTECNSKYKGDISSYTSEDLKQEVLITLWKSKLLQIIKNKNFSNEEAYSYIYASVKKTITRTLFQKRRKKKLDVMNGGYSHVAEFDIKKRDFSLTTEEYIEKLKRVIESSDSKVTRRLNSYLSCLLERNPQKKVRAYIKRKIKEKIDEIIEDV